MRLAITCGSHVIAIIIKNSPIAETYTNHFEHWWNTSIRKTNYIAAYPSPSLTVEKVVQLRLCDGFVGNLI